MKYKYDSMGRFVDYEFVDEFVKEFLPTLITYEGFIRKENIDEVDESGNVIDKEVAQPLTYRYLDDEIALTSLNGYPFIEQYFYNHLSDFFAPIKYDKYSEYKPSKYLNDSEIALLITIGVDVPVDLDAFDPNFKKKLEGKTTLYNPFYFNHTKEQVTFLLDNLSALTFMLDLIIQNLNTHKHTILLNIKDIYTIEDNEETNTNNLSDLQKSLKDYNPSKFNISSIKHSSLNTYNINAVYNLIKKELFTKYKDSKVLNKDDYPEYLINYKIIDMQQTLISGILGTVKEHHTFCKKLELIKTREIFSVRLSNLLEQKDIHTPTVLAWLGITPQTLSDYKRSKTLPDTTKLIILSKNLGVSVDYLLGLSDLKDHKYYPAYTSFKEFGITSEAFDTLYYIKKEKPWAYAHLITTLNLLLEEEGITTLTDITNYITHRLADDFYTINTKTVQDLENDITKLLDSNKDAELIKNTLKSFKNNLPLSSIDNLDATTLLSIQQNLIKLKNHTAKNANLMDEKIMPYFEKLWLKDNELNEDELNSEVDFIEEDYNADDSSNESPF